ncbi:unnamed protein product [Merluccius merluccius]
MGGCSNTESPIPKGVKSGVWDGEQAGVSGAQGPGCGVEMEEVRQVLGDKAVEGLVCEEKDFIFDAVLDQEPVEAQSKRRAASPRQRGVQAHFGSILRSAPRHTPAQPAPLPTH